MHASEAFHRFELEQHLISAASQMRGPFAQAEAPRKFVKKNVGEQVQRLPSRMKLLTLIRRIPIQYSHLKMAIHHKNEQQGPGPAISQHSCLEAR